MMTYNGVIDDQIDFIDCTGTRYNITPLIIASGKGQIDCNRIFKEHNLQVHMKKPKSFLFMELIQINNVQQGKQRNNDLY